MAKIYVDDVSVGVKELYEVLGIDPKSIPGKLQRIFEISPSKVTKDEHGNEKTPRRLGIPTKFTVQPLRGDKAVTVRYATVAIPNNKNGFVVTNYSPGQLWINGKEENITEDLVYVFMYLHPDCFQSPFRQVGGNYRYLFKDNEALAKVDLLRDEQEMRAMSMIIGESALSFSQLKQIAKGMNIAGIDALSEAEVKNRLKALAKKDPAKFFNDARSNTIAFNGLIQDAVDKHVVTIVANNGYKRWYFVNEEICIIPSGGDESLVLREGIANRMELFTQIAAALEGRTLQNKIESPENSHYFNQFKTDMNITRQQVSPNLNAENKEVNAQADHQANIKLLAEQEDAELAGGEKMHYQRKNKLNEFRAEVDAYKASLQAV